jgi:hypothetical protein
MEPTYTVMGGDGKQYGPVSAEQLRGWVTDGRIGGDTQIWRSDQASWVAAAALPELGIPGVATATIPSPIHVTVPVQDPELEQRVKSGASWFYWIAGLSMVNSVAALAGWSIGFYFGLGITQWIDGWIGRVQGGGTIIALALDAAAAGLLVLFGVFANKGQAWAFIVGMLLLALDSVVVAITALIVSSEWISFGFHVFALFCIFAGYRASRALRA